MRLKNLILTIASLTLINAQSSEAQTKAKPITIKNCHLIADTASISKVTLADAQAWADKLPLEIKCGNSETYFLKQFNITIILMNPMITKDYGIGNDGIPIMARRAIDSMKAGDTVFLKDVTAKDKDGNEVKLPSIVFSIAP